MQNIKQPVSTEEPPVIGFGLDYQYREQYTYDGLGGLWDKFESRLSHLSIVSVPDCMSGQALKQTVSKRRPIIHHLSGIAPASAGELNLERLALQSSISDEMAALWCLEDIGIWSLGPYDIPYFVPPLFNDIIARHTAARISLIQQEINIPFLAEIPSCSFVVGPWSLGQFFYFLTDNTKCKIVLDVSHVFSYALATDSDPLAVLESLPLDNVWEIHIAGGRLNPFHDHRYIDSHSDLIMPEVISLLTCAIKRCANLRAITYEIGVKSTPQTIEQDMETLEETIRQTQFMPRLAPNFEIKKTSRTVLEIN
jgi:uncharacterized protein (UPF0276 family)